MRRPVILIAALAFLGCTDFTGLGELEQRVLRNRLEKAEARWAANGPATYVLTIQRLCFCSTIEPRQVTVVDGVVTDVREVGAATPLPEAEWRWYPSVEALFAIAHEAIDQPAAALALDFHDTLGYAVQVDIDWDYGIADDEVTFLVTSFIPSF